MAELKTCETCGGQLSSAARSCPHCGEPMIRASKVRRSASVTRRPRAKSGEHAAGAQTSGSRSRREERRAEKKSNSTTLLAVISALGLLVLIVVVLVLFRSSSNESGKQAKSETRAEAPTLQEDDDPLSRERPGPEEKRPLLRPAPKRRRPDIEDQRPEPPHAKPDVPAVARAELAKLASYWRFAEAKAALEKLEQSGKYRESQFLQLYQWLALQRAMAHKAHRDTLLAEARASFESDPGKALNKMRAALPFAGEDKLVQQINLRIDELKEAPKKAFAARLRELSSFLKSEQYDFVRMKLNGLLKKDAFTPLHPFILDKLKSLAGKPEGKGLLGRWMRALADFDIHYRGELRPAKERRRCTQCQGRRYSPCGGCNDQGAVDGNCGVCQASGESSCSTCKGLGQQTCKRCKGRRRIASSSYTEISCPSCNGRPTLCNRCGNTRRIKQAERGSKDCPNCDAKGTADCSGCKGSGSRACRNCKGTRRGLVPHIACGGLNRVYCTRCKGIALRGIRNFVDSITDGSYQITGYRKRPPRGWQGPTSSRFVAQDLGVNTSTSHAANHTPTAIALLIRLLMGTDKNHPAVRDAATVLASSLPVWKTGGGGKLNQVDYYYWYYGALALRKLGGARWHLWNRALKRALLASQVKAGHAGGSWPAVGAWGFAGGRVYSTAINVLTMQVYYR